MNKQPLEKRLTRREIEELFLEQKRHEGSGAPRKYLLSTTPLADQIEAAKKAEQRIDIHSVYEASIAAGQSLMQYLRTHKGPFDVLGDDHYVSLTAGVEVNIGPDQIDKLPEDRVAFIRNQLEKPNYQGVVPATPKALEQITEMGLSEVARGRIIENVNPIANGTPMILYN